MFSKLGPNDLLANEEREAVAALQRDAQEASQTEERSCGGGRIINVTGIAEEYSC